MRHQQCPEPGNFRRFAKGDIPTAEHNRIAAHLDDCAQCRFELANMTRLAKPAMAHQATALATSTPAVQACPSEDLVIGFVDGGLSASEREGIEKHIDQCPHCRVLVSVMVREERGDDEEDPAEVEARRIGRFELEKVLGEGGMGVVFLARDPILRRQVAVKVIRPELFDSAGAARLLREARAAARLSHPNVVTIYDVATEGNQVFIAMEFVAGMSLREHLRDGLPWREAIGILFEAGEGLIAAHEVGLVHRDFKPDNVLVGESGRAQVTDFGIAYCDDEEGSSTTMRGSTLRMATLSEASSREVAGTPLYMAPEQYLGAKPTEAADQYAFAVTVYEAVYGVRPFDATSLAELEAMVLAGAVARPPVDNHVPAAVLRVLTRAMATDPDGRFSTFREFLTRLRRAAHGSEVEVDEERDRPYLGLSAFSAGDAGRYFGRSSERAHALRILEDRRFLAVVGPSGVGKSSFVNAGIFPELDRENPWQLIRIRPGRNGLERLARALVRLTECEVNEGSLSVEELAVQIESNPQSVAEILGRASKQGRSCLLFVDQFEELFTLERSVNRRDAFAEILRSIAESALGDVRVVLALRSDFVDKVAEQRVLLRQLTAGLLMLTSPTERDLREALVNPLAPFGYRFESEELVAEIVGELVNARTALPLLQFAAARLWNARDRERHVISEESYRKIGTIAGALAGHADAVVGAFPAETRLLIRSLFLRLVTPDRTRDVVLVSDLLSLAPDDRNVVEGVVERLVEERLLVVHEGESGASAELVHEALINSWPTLRRWLSQSVDDANRLADLRSAARQWEQRSRDPGLLWRGDMAVEAKRLGDRAGEQLSSHEREFVKAAFTEQSRVARRRRRLVGAVITSLALIAIVTTSALLKVRHAERQASDMAAAMAAEAERAREAERRVQRQLHEIQAEQERRLLAERSAREAGEQVVDSRAQLADKNAELTRALADVRLAENAAKKANAELIRTNAELKRKKLQAEAELLRLKKKGKALSNKLD